MKVFLTNNLKDYYIKSFYNYFILQEKKNIFLKII